MAVYHGARPSLGTRAGLRPRSGAAGEAAAGGGTATGTLRRRRVRAAGAVRAGRRSNHVGIVLGGIVVGFLLAFFSLAQTMRVSATGYEIDRLEIQRDRLESQSRDLRSDINRLGNEPAIRKQALDLGLGQLGGAVIVEPR